MSTRANIVLQENYSFLNEKGKQVNKINKLYFYRHSDGYPEGVLPSLNKFMEWLKSGKIRDNVGQAAGWLIIIGAIEYKSIPKYETEEIEYSFRTGVKKLQYKSETIKDPSNWKCGAYEPTDGLHGDIEFKYEINLTKKTLTSYERTGNWNKLTFKKIETSELNIKKF